MELIISKNLSILFHLYCVCNLSVFLLAKSKVSVYSQKLCISNVCSRIWKAKWKLYKQKNINCKTSMKIIYIMNSINLANKYFICFLYTLLWAKCVWVFKLKLASSSSRHSKILHLVRLSKRVFSAPLLRTWILSNVMNEFITLFVYLALDVFFILNII